MRIITLEPEFPFTEVYSIEGANGQRAIIIGNGFFYRVNFPECRHAASLEDLIKYLESEGF